MAKPSVLVIMGKEEGDQGDEGGRGGSLGSLAVVEEGLGRILPGLGQASSAGGEEVVPSSSDEVAGLANVEGGRGVDNRGGVVGFDQEGLAGGGALQEGVANL